MDVKDETLVTLFFDISRLSKRQASKQKKGNSELFLGQFRCIYTLLNTGAIEQKKLAEILNIRSTSLSELLVRLEKKKLIFRVPSKNDRRTWVISLTDEGKTEAEKYKQSRAKAYVEMVAPLSTEEKEELFHIFSKIKEHYKAIEQEGEKRNE